MLFIKGFPVCLILPSFSEANQRDDIPKIIILATQRSIIFTGTHHYTVIHIATLQKTNTHTLQYRQSHYKQQLNLFKIHNNDIYINTTNRLIYIAIVKTYIITNYNKRKLKQ